MHTFSYTPDPNNPHDHISVTVSTQTPSLAELLEAFESYLKATGFHFDGVVDIVEEDGEISLDIEG